MTDDCAGSGGTYTLLVEVHDATTADVGALGTLSFEPGWYAYTGSALGTGGFSRVERHRELAAGQRDTRHWHVDYLLGLDEATVDTTVRSHDVDVECGVATALDAEAIPDFGCSDCDCLSHLHYHPQRDALLSDVRRAHRSLDDDGPRTRSRG